MNKKKYQKAGIKSGAREDNVSGIIRLQEGIIMCYNARVLNTDRKQEVMNMKIKKMTALIMAGVISCMTPAAVIASEQDLASAESMIESLVTDGYISELLSDPDKVVDIIMFVKNLLKDQNITEGDISSAIDMAADEFGISLSDSEKSSLVSIVKEMIEMDIDEDEMRDYVEKIYSTMERLGIDQEDGSGIIKKGISILKRFLS